MLDISTSRHLDTCRPVTQTGEHMRSRRTAPLTDIEWIDGVPVGSTEAASLDGSTVQSHGHRLSERLDQRRQDRFSVSVASDNSAISKPVAQIVQATRLSPTIVVNHLNRGTSTGRLFRRLAITRGTATVRVADGDRASGTPNAGRNEVAFEGHLWAVFPPVRRVVVRVYPSASNNLTIIEVLPTRLWTGSTRWFIRAGVHAVTALTDEIERKAVP